MPFGISVTIFFIENYNSKGHYVDENRLRELVTSINIVMNTLESNLGKDIIKGNSDMNKSRIEMLVESKLKNKLGV